MSTNAKTGYGTYLTTDGEIIDLTGLTPDEAAILDAAVAALARNMEWPTYTNRFLGPNSDMLRTTHGRITTDVWESPLFKAVRDIEDRIGIKQGAVAADPDTDLDTDPFDESWIPSAKAAAAKGVTLPGLHAAVKAGTIVARPIKPGGTRIEISKRSLDRWELKAHNARARRNS